MGKPIFVLISTFLFAIMGLAIAITILWGLPEDFYDPKGYGTAFMVVLPCVGGALFGLFVGMIAASYWARSGSAKS